MTYSIEANHLLNNLHTAYKGSNDWARMPERLSAMHPELLATALVIATERQERAS